MFFFIIFCLKRCTYIDIDINEFHLSLNYRTFKGTRTRAALVFILGFWMLDLANNTVQVTLLNQLCLPFLYIDAVK